MVDALRRVTRFLQPSGCIVDLHPTADRAVVEVAGVETGAIDAPSAPERHAGADAAVARVVRERLVIVDAEEVFAFHTYGDSADELREYIEEDWRDARIPADVLTRTAAALRQAGRGVRPRIRERVRLTKLLVAAHPD